MRTRTELGEFQTTAFLVVIPLLEGFALWFFIPRFFYRMFGSLWGLSVPLGVLVLILGLFVFFSLFNVLRYAQGKFVRRWQLDTVIAVGILLLQFTLGEVYLLVFPSFSLGDSWNNVFWRYYLLPFATWAVGLNLIGRIPRVRKKIDAYIQYDVG